MKLFVLWQKKKNMYTVGTLTVVLVVLLAVQNLKVATNVVLSLRLVVVRMVFIVVLKDSPVTQRERCAQEN